VQWYALPPKPKEQLTKIAKAEIKLSEFCERVRENLAQCIIQEKRLALDALNIKVTASPEQIDIRGTIPTDITTTQTPSEFITTEQTWA